jgi:hypothetical protein
MASADDLAHGRAVRPMLKAVVAIMQHHHAVVLRPSHLCQVLPNMVVNDCGDE